jgi:hypothetical protein
LSFPFVSSFCELAPQTDETCPITKAIILIVHSQAPALSLHWVFRVRKEEIISFGERVRVRPVFSGYSSS